MTDRAKIPTEVQAEVLLNSARRCCLCFGLNGDATIKKGQIAHLDQDRAKNDLSNLVYLCFDHHDEFDSTTSQSKGLTKSEVARYRRSLHEYVRTSLSLASTTRAIVESSVAEQESILNLIERYWNAGTASPTTLASEVQLRMQRIWDYHRLVEEERSKSQPNLSEEEKERQWQISTKSFREALDLPEGIWGMLPDGDIPESIFRKVRELSIGWSKGMLSYTECHRLFWLLDEDLDFDQYFILYGIPLEALGPLGVAALDSFLYEFGMRNSEKEPD